MVKIYSAIKSIYASAWTNTKGQLELSEDLTIAPLLSFFGRVRKTMTGNNPKLDLVNVDAHKKIGILSLCSQGIGGKQNYDIHQRSKLYQKFGKNDREQSQARSCQR